MEKESAEYLFVYGTLMRSYPQNPLKEEINVFTTYLGKAYTYGKLFLVDYYPGLVKNVFDEEFITFGEIYQLNQPNKLLPTLDEYEDCAPNDLDKSLYIREKAKCFTSDGNSEIYCWVYYYNRPTDKLKLFINGEFLFK